MEKVTEFSKEIGRQSFFTQPQHQLHHLQHQPQGKGGNKGKGGGGEGEGTQQQLLQSLNYCTLQITGCEILGGEGGEREGERERGKGGGGGGGLRRKLSELYYKSLTGGEEEGGYEEVRKGMEEKVEGVVRGVEGSGGRYRCRVHLFVSCLIGLFFFFFFYVFIS